MEESKWSYDPANQVENGCEKYKIAQVTEENLN